MMAGSLLMSRSILCCLPTSRIFLSPAEPVASSAPAPGECGDAFPVAHASHKLPGAALGPAATSPLSPRRLAFSSAHPPFWQPVSGHYSEPVPAALLADVDLHWHYAVLQLPAVTSPFLVGTHSLGTTQGSDVTNTNCSHVLYLLVNVEVDSAANLHNETF